MNQFLTSQPLSLKSFLKVKYIVRQPSTLQHQLSGKFQKLGSRQSNLKIRQQLNRNILLVCQQGVEDQDNNNKKSTQQDPKLRSSKNSRQQSPGEGTKPKLRNVIIGFCLLALANILGVLLFWNFAVPSYNSYHNKINQVQQQSLVVPFSQFNTFARKKNIQAVNIQENRIQFTVKKSIYAKLNKSAKETSYLTVKPDGVPIPYQYFGDNVQVQAIEKQDLSWMVTMANTLLLVAVFAIIFRDSFSKVQESKPGTKLFQKPTPVAVQQVLFKDIAGIDEAKEDLQEVVEFLKNPQEFAKLGASIPKGLLLCGPPGTGKTMLAKAVAGEAGVPFFSMSASEFVELYVGVGAKKVRELFQVAKQQGSSIVFIDEIDAVAKSRSSNPGSSNDEREQTLNQLLVEMDGFDTSSQVVVIAATNRPEVLDEAILRPGRFDRRVAVEAPDKIGREQILRVHTAAKKLPLSKDVNLQVLSSATTGSTGAELANIVNEAALYAAREKAQRVTMKHFEFAVQRCMMGVEKKRSILGSEEKEIVSKHEIGHALVATALTRILPQQAPVKKLSIVPMVNGALGFTYAPPKDEDRVLIYDAEIRAQLCLLMGGRAAEALTCKRITTGAVDDIKKATDLARRAVTELGINDKIGPINVGVLGSQREMGIFSSGQNKINEDAQHEVQQLIQEALQVASDVIKENRVLHSCLSKELLKNEKMDQKQLQPYFDMIQVPESLKQFIKEAKDIDSLFLYENLSTIDQQILDLYSQREIQNKVLQQNKPNVQSYPLEDLSSDDMQELAQPAFLF